MVTRREREARNEARFHTQNEWVETTGAAPELRLAFVCECGDDDCGRSIRLLPRLAVVDKVTGWGLRLSRETDPRSSSGSQTRTPA